MPPAVDIEPYRDEIISLSQTGASSKAISDSLRSTYSLNISPRTIHRRLETWGIVPSTSAKDTALHDRLRTLIFQLSLSDQQILPILQTEGYKISNRTIRRLRNQLGIHRRVVSAEGKADRAVEIQQVIESEINIGEIEGFGKNLLHNHLRRHGYLFPR